jgi:hypothetical protein
MERKRSLCPRCGTEAPLAICTICQKTMCHPCFKQHSGSTWHPQAIPVKSEVSHAE